MKQIMILIAFFISFVPCLASGQEVNINKILFRLASKMNVTLDSKIPLPKMEVVTQKQMNQVVAELMENQLGKKSIYFQGYTALEIVENNVEIIEARYDIVENKIWFVEGCSVEVVVHELVHYIQCCYQHKYLPLAALQDQEVVEEILADPQKIEKVMAVEQAIEKEAEEITREFFKTDQKLQLKAFPI